MRRLPRGGRVDRTRPLSFWLDGTRYTGFAGDTVASALLGAGVDVIGASVSAGRPRGIMASGFEEPTGFAQVVETGVSEPLVRLSAVRLVDGMRLEGGPRIAKGYLQDGMDPARFDKRHAHVDVLVIGAGPAGMAAAASAAAAGVEVMLIDAAGEPGGALVRDGEAAVAQELQSALGAVRFLPHCTALMLLDGNGIIAMQRDVDAPTQGRMWQVRARAIVHATGMLERPVVFADNDRPGVMLASAARDALERYAVAPERGTVFTTTDDGYRTALAWHAAGVEVAAIVDPRPPGSGALRHRAELAGLRIIDRAVVEGTDGDAQSRLSAIRVRSRDGRVRVATDLLAVCGGWEPNLNLHLHLRGATRYDAWWCAAVPDRPLPGQSIAGGANGRGDTASCLEEGVRAAREALGTCGVPVVEVGVPAVPAVIEDEPAQLWRVPAADGDESRSFVDLHRDATVAGVQRAAGSGLTHIEHIKRYTLIGTGIEQGRSARVNAGVLAAALLDQPVAQVGTSGSRPPVEPVAFHALAGRAHGAMFEPVRRTSLHARHEALGATFEPAGQWLRPTCYPRPFEGATAAIRRECRAVRTDAGIADVSTLGKIDVQGPDATWFLEQLYVNAIGTIPVGKGRYSLMCRMDGAILDDGLVLRLAEQRYLVTTSTSHAAAVVDWMEEWLQTEWPTRRVWVTPVTEQWATVAIAGPNARAVLQQVMPGVDASREGFPFLGVRRTEIAGVCEALVARVSFSGELAFEVSVPWDLAHVVWDRAVGAGATPYGLEALQSLRIEKGYIIVGQDTEGTTTPHDAGLGWLVGRGKACIGQRSWQRPAMRAADRPQLVGIAPWDGTEEIPEGAALTRRVHAPPMALEGHVTSFRWSETLGRSLGLALVRGGRARMGETLYAPLDGGVAAVSIVDPVHYDPAGARRDG
ncbi:MAG: (2Fe-2S)-binding protein [Gemmatimonadetes bacterium]|nr:(2Fe-2S)-binding protein [Gemmatimonadota bacterium]